jgi:hypothetical protein
MSERIIEDEFFNFGDDQVSKQYYGGELIPELGKIYPYREPSPGLYQGERSYSDSESHFSHYYSQRKKWIAKEQELLHNDETSSRYKSIIEGEIRKRSESRPSVQYPYYIDRVYRARNGLPEPEGVGQSPIFRVECNCRGSGYYQGELCRLCSGSGYLTKAYCRCCLGSGNGYKKSEEYEYIEYSRIACECCNGSKTVYVTLPPQPPQQTFYRSTMVGGKRRGTKKRKYSQKKTKHKSRYI